MFTICLQIKLSLNLDGTDEGENNEVGTNLLNLEMPSISECWKLMKDDMFKVIDGAMLEYNQGNESLTYVDPTTGNSWKALQDLLSDNSSRKAAYTDALEKMYDDKNNVLIDKHILRTPMCPISKKWLVVNNQDWQGEKFNSKLNPNSLDIKPLLMFSKSTEDSPVDGKTVPVIRFALLFEVPISERGMSTGKKEETGGSTPSAAFTKLADDILG